MPDIKEWVRQQLKAGFSKEKIRQTLVKSGYDPNLLEEVLSESLIKQETTYKLMPKSSNIPTVLIIVSFFVGIIIALYISNIYNTKVGFLKYEDILSQNPKLATYIKSTTCRENLGFIFHPPEINVNRPRFHMLIFNNELIGGIYIWPATEGWFSHADQPEGNPINISGVPSYTQVIHFKNGPTLEDCARATG